MNGLVFAASLAGVFVLAGVAWWLKLGGKDAALGDADTVRRAAEDSLSGFVARAALIGDDRRAALVIGEGSRVAILKAHGARIATREVRWSDVRAIHGGMRVETGERRFGHVDVAGIDTLDVRRAAGDDLDTHR